MLLFIICYNIKQYFKFKLEKIARIAIFSNNYHYENDDIPRSR